MLYGSALLVVIAGLWSGIAGMAVNSFFAWCVLAILSAPW